MVQAVACFPRADQFAWMGEVAVSTIFPHGISDASIVMRKESILLPSGWDLGGTRHDADHECVERKPVAP